MYYENNDQSQLENLKILRLISDSPAKACDEDPVAKAAFEESLRNLAEDIIEFSPGLAHILLGMSKDPDDSYSGGQN